MRAPRQVLRDGAPLTLDVQLMKPTPLVPMHLAGQDPTFFVVAGAALPRPSCCAFFVRIN